MMEDITEHNNLVQPKFRIPDASNDELDLTLYTNLLQHNVVPHNQIMPAVSSENCSTKTYDDSDISLHKCWSSDSKFDVPDYVLELDCLPLGPPSVNSAESFTEEMIVYCKDLAYEEIDGWANNHKAKMDWEDDAINFYLLSMEEGQRPY